MSAYVSFELGTLIQALVAAQTTLPDAREPNETWAVATERRRAGAAVSRLLENFEQATTYAEHHHGDVCVDYKLAVWRLASVIEECAPWTTLKAAGRQARLAAEAANWQQVLPGPTCTVDARWQTEWHDEVDLELRWDAATQRDVPREASA
ncbi:hypothetical protein Mx8p08 [Myxococcus phage Mx8]|nr:hypothetical protein Mx8p08 [Myxococcus phage Mx8]AAK94343.1 p8 [Myxococcus phage Mx8]